MGVHMMIPETLKFFHDPVEGMIGVIPFNAHVLETNGRSDIPDSS